MKNKKKLSRGEIKEIQSILTKAGWEQTTYRDRKYGGYEFGQPNTPWVNILDTREAVIVYPRPMNNIWSGDCWDFTETIERLVEDAWEAVAGESEWKLIPGGRYMHPDKEYALTLPLSNRFYHRAPGRVYFERLGKPIVTITNDDLLAELYYKTPKEESGVPVPTSPSEVTAFTRMSGESDSLFTFRSYDEPQSAEPSDRTGVTYWTEAANRAAEEGKDWLRSPACSPLSIEEASAARAAWESTEFGSAQETVLAGLITCFTANVIDKMSNCKRS